MASTYRVDFEAFHGSFEYPRDDGMRDAIGQLIARYHLRGKSILCIGSGKAGEEYWLWKLGANRLTIVDFDEWKDIEPVLRKLRKGDLTYHIGDALTYFARWNWRRLWPYDAVYISGFTPDVMQRHQVMNDRSEDTVKRKKEANVQLVQWPPWADPFHAILMVAAKQLRRGGLLINQSFGFGFDTLYHTHFMPAVERQLAANGMSLVEAYRMSETIGVSLYVGRVKGGRDLALGPSITRIHGRAATQERAELIWPLTRPKEPAAVEAAPLAK